MLDDLDFLYGVLLDLGKADGKDTVFEYGFDVLFLYRDRKRDTAAEFTPIAFLYEIILYGVLGARRERTVDTQRVICDAYVEIAFIHACGPGFDYKPFLRFVYINSQLSWQHGFFIVPLVGCCDWLRSGSIAYSRYGVIIT